ncbi:hypothetical protein [Streptomyces sp. NPDC013181]|uniref:hypothetical protein n=1 Tax=Streptomyces sp. NPDC013181 TaxID=3364864 RepID=UPI00367D116E
MPVSARNPRRARLVVTLVGLAVVILGGILWLVGDENEVTGSSRMDLNSSATWGEVLGYASDRADEYDAAKELRDTGETQMSWGVVLAVLGVAAIGSRWLISPTPAPAKPAAIMLTPEQQQQAIAMYLEAQQRASDEK